MQYYMHLIVISRACAGFDLVYCNDKIPHQYMLIDKVTTHGYLVNSTSIYPQVVNVRLNLWRWGTHL